MASSALLTRVLAPQQIKEDPESLQIWGKDWTNGLSSPKRCGISRVLINCKTLCLCKIPSAQPCAFRRAHGIVGWCCCEPR